MRKNVDVIVVVSFEKKEEKKKTRSFLTFLSQYYPTRLVKDQE